MYSPPAATPTTCLGVLDASTLAVGTGDRSKPAAGTLELWDLKAGRRLEPVRQEPNGVRGTGGLSGEEPGRLVDRPPESPRVGHSSSSSAGIPHNPHQFRRRLVCDRIERSRPLSTGPPASTTWRSVMAPAPVLKGHKGQVTAIALSPDGQSVATGSSDCTMPVGTPPPAWRRRASSGRSGGSTRSLTRGKGAANRQQATWSKSLCRMRSGGGIGE